MAQAGKSIESAAESLFGDERLRSNLTDDEAKIILERALAWLEGRARTSVAGATAKQVDLADLQFVRQAVAAINTIARHPGVPQLPDAIAEIAPQLVGTSPLVRHQVLALLTTLAQGFFQVRASRK